jgi:hypothetical protein
MHRLAFFDIMSIPFHFFQSIMPDLSSPADLRQHILSADVAVLSFSAPW